MSLSTDMNSGWLIEAAKWRIIDDILFGDPESEVDWNSR